MKRYYVVWEGRHPGVYDNIEDMLEQVDGYDGASFKGFDSATAAAAAYRSGASGSPTGAREERKQLGEMLARSGGVGVPPDGKPDYMTIPEVDLNAWAVDASCMGNPGVMEYRGVELMSGRELFRVGPFADATNNIGEFLAIVHALAMMHQSGEWHTIYSDSVTGMSWVRNRKIKTQLKETAKNKRVFDMVRRAMGWLNTHQYACKIVKWQTPLWGEIPADFDRK